MYLAAGFPIELLPDSWTKAIDLLLDEDTRYWNRLIIPIYASLKHNSLITRLSETAQEKLKKKFLELLALQLRQQTWLIKLVEFLKKTDKEIIFLKNSAFAGDTYESDYSRLSQDIDILVHAKDYNLIKRRLQEFGSSKPKNRNRLFSDAHRNESHIVIDTPVTFSVEIHRSLFPKYLFSINEDQLWVRSQKHPLFDSDLLRVLSMEDSILHNAVHSFMHLEYEPHHLVDMSRFLKRYNPDPNVLKSIALKWGCSRILYSMLSNLEFWMGTTIPVNFNNRTKRSFNRWGYMIQNPSNPANTDPVVKDQLKSMILHDRYSRVAYFALYYSSKRVLDKILKHAFTNRVG